MSSGVKPQGAGGRVPEPGGAAQAVSSELRRLRQEDCYKSQVNADCIVGYKETEATEGGPVSSHKSEKHK